MTNDETSRLRAKLAELHGELSRLPPDAVNDTRRTELLDLQTELERLLSQGETDVAHEDRQQLHGRLQTLVAGFEGAHPQFTTALEETMNALGNMGL